jgi:hypothetical protein
MTTKLSSAKIKHVSHFQFYEIPANYSNIRSIRRLYDVFRVCTTKQTTENYVYSVYFQYIMTEFEAAKQKLVKGLPYVCPLQYIIRC